MFTLGDFKGQMNGEATVAMDFLDMSPTGSVAAPTTTATSTRPSTSPSTTTTGGEVFDIRSMAKRLVQGEQPPVSTPRSGDDDSYAQEWNPPDRPPRSPDDLRTVDWCGQMITPEEANARKAELNQITASDSGGAYVENPIGSNCYEWQLKSKRGKDDIPPWGGPMDPYKPQNGSPGGGGGIPTGITPEEWENRTPGQIDDPEAFTGDSGGGSGSANGYGGGGPEGGDVGYTGGAGGGAYDKSGIEKFKDKVEDISGLPWWILLIVAGTTAYIAFKPKKKDTTV